MTLSRMDGSLTCLKMGGQGLKFFLWISNACGNMLLNSKVLNLCEFRSMY